MLFDLDKSDSYARASPTKPGPGKRRRGGEIPSMKIGPVLDVKNSRSYKPLEQTNIPEILDNNNSPMSDKHDNTTPERFPSSPDQLEKDSSLEGPDPSQAQYEVLISTLFDRIRASLVGDEITQTLEKRLKLGLIEIRGLYYKGNLLYIPRDPTWPTESTVVFI